MWYVGVVDGGGDYGSSVCDEYECDCGNIIERGCIDTEDDDFTDYEGEDYDDFEDDQGDSLAEEHD
jgi:hypothetical protein